MWSFPPIWRALIGWHASARGHVVVSLVTAAYLSVTGRVPEVPQLRLISMFTIVIVGTRVIYKFSNIIYILMYLYNSTIQKWL